MTVPLPDRSLCLVKSNMNYENQRATEKVQHFYISHVPERHTRRRNPWMPSPPPVPSAFDMKLFFHSVDRYTRKPSTENHLSHRFSSFCALVPEMLCLRLNQRSQKSIFWKRTVINKVVMVAKALMQRERTLRRNRHPVLHFSVDSCNSVFQPGVSTVDGLRTSDKDTVYDCAA